MSAQNPHPPSPPITTTTTFLGGGVVVVVGMRLRWWIGLLLGALVMVVP